MASTKIHNAEAALGNGFDNTAGEWQQDMLGEGFEMKHVDMPADYTGRKQQCTIVRKLVPGATKAVLYVHGFSDYFLQHEMANMFVDNGYSFYAVDLRKYGRSLTATDRMFQVRDIHEYFDDINAAVGQMKADGITEAALLGHSTGGLTSALYMSEKPDAIFKLLMLNSPFLAWNMPAFLRYVAVPVIRGIGKIFPAMPVYQAPDNGYARTLSADLEGEWKYRRDWKPDVLPNPDAAWVGAIDRAQRQLRRRHIDVPVLLMHSAESAYKRDGIEKYFHADAILDVKSIAYYGKHLGTDVTEVTFKDGLHDLALSAKPIRKKVYATMLDWLKEHGM